MISQIGESQRTDRDRNMNDKPFAQQGKWDNTILISSLESSQIMVARLSDQLKDYEKLAETDLKVQEDLRKRLQTYVILVPS